MASWKNNDREQSKPNWLTEEQKRQCVRTNRGWEIPMPGSNPIDATSDSHIDYELLVALSVPTTDTAYTTRDSESADNDAPYFTTPLTGDSVTAGGWDGGGNTACGVSQGVTGYIPVFVGDPDSLDVYTSMVITGPWINGVLSATFGLLTPGNPIAAGNGYPKAGYGLGYTGAGTLTESLVNTYMGGYTSGGALLQVRNVAATGSYNVMIRAYDDAGLTAEVTFKAYVGYTGF